MSYIDWNGADEATKAYNDQTAGAQQQLAQSQQLRALSALQGVNLNDPAALNGSINALARLGMFDQASALSGLYKTSAINQSVVPLVQSSIQNAEQSQNQPQQSNNLDTEKHQRLLTEADQALTDIMSSPDEATRQQKAQNWRAHFAAEGVPEDAIDGVVGDLSDAGLQGHQANIRRDLQQYTVQSSPGYAQAAGALNGPLANPIVMGALGGAGIDVAPGLGLAANITSPARSEQVQAAYAPGIAGATTAATNVAGANTADAQRTSSEAVAGGAAAGGAPYELVPGLTDPTTGAPLYRSRAEFAASRPGGPPLPGAGAAPAIPSAGAPPGVAQAAAETGGASGQQLASDRASAAGLQATVTPLRQIRNLLPTTNIGPGTPGTNEIRSFIIAQLPWLQKFDPSYWDAAKIKTANYDDLQKYMAQVATTGLNATFGQGSDQRFAAIESGNPHATMSQLGAKAVTDLAIAAARAQAAPALIYGNRPPQDYAGWKANFGSTVDPRGFMLDLLSKQDRAKMLAGIPRGSTEADNLVRGKQAAERAGMFTETDIPR